MLLPAAIECRLFEFLSHTHTQTHTHTHTRIHASDDSSTRMLTRAHTHKHQMIQATALPEPAAGVQSRLPNM